MLPHTGLFLLGKVALQMRIRRPLAFRRNKLKAGFHHCQFIVIYAGSGFILKPSRYVKFLKRTDFPQEKLEGK